MSNKVLFLFSIMAFAVLMYASMAKAQVVSDGLVAYWTFDDIDGDTVKDIVGGNDGTITGGNLKQVAGKVGKALEFDGAGYIDTESEVAELGGANFSFAFWIKTAVANKAILIKDDGDGSWESHEKLLYVADSAFSEGPNTGPVEYVGWGCDWIRGSIEVDDDEWHHVAVTWDGSTGHVYTDGEEGTFEVNFNGGADNVGETVKLGISPGEHSEGFFEGLLDDFRIYDRTLSADEVGQVMAETGAAVGAAGKLTVTWGTIKEL